MTKRLFVVLFWCAAATLTAGSQPGPVNVDPWREFPSLDLDLSGPMRTAANVRRAEQAYREAPAASTTIRYQLDTNRIDRAIDGLRLAARGDVENLIAALDVATSQFHRFEMDATKGYRDRVAEIVPLIRQRLTELPRETAARLARALLTVDSYLERGGSRDWPARVNGFLHTYKDTDAGVLTEVDSLTAGVDIPARLSGLDAFWKTHPGSVAGAKALFLKGFDLHVNVAITGIERRGSDPTDRFLQVIAIVDELENGRYPDCDWVRKAPELIIGFFVSNSPPPAYSAENITRTLAAYQRFVRKHFDPVGTEDAINSSIGYVITSKMGDLYQLQGDRYGGIERTLADLATIDANRRAVELFRGQYLTNRAAGVPTADRPAIVATATEALTSLAEADAGYYSRKAAATLAALKFFSRDHAGALQAHQAYASRYPASPYASVARVRTAQSLASLGDQPQATTVLERVARDDTQEPVARMVASTLLAQSFDRLERFDRSLPAYQRALAVWSPDFGRDVPTLPRQITSPATATGASTAPLRITREFLVDRVDSLTRHLPLPNGTVLERGLWQISARQFEAARDTLRSAIAKGGDRATAAEATRLLHRAELEIAMNLAAIEGSGRDDDAALKALDELAAAPFDSMVGLAGMARATLQFTRGQADDAKASMTSTLTRWLTAQQPLRKEPPASPLAADVARIRDIVFQPTGGLALLQATGWDAFSFPASLPYIVVNPVVQVGTADGQSHAVTVYQDLQGREQTLYLTTDEIALASRLIVTLGGTRRAAPASVMATPNQPVGRAVDVMKFWDGFFPARQGHWGGWVIETYPIITRIEFLDDTRTTAGVLVVVGYSGCTVVMEKRDGVWRAIKIVNQWIT